jgi:hypothetical protein
MQEFAWRARCSGSCMRMLSWMLVAPTVIAASAACGCHGKLSTPTNHRAEALGCGTRSPRSMPAFTVAGAECSMDSDCTASPGGRCEVVSPWSSEIPKCYYDTCQQDSDCPNGGVCECGGSGGGTNACSPGGDKRSCRVDADCPHFLCSMDEIDGCAGVYPAPYHCHSDDDECGSTADCHGAPGEATTCVFSKQDNKWECIREHPCGPY